MEEAKKNMHAFSTTTYTGFQCTEETSENFKDYRLELRMVGQPMIEAATAVAKIPKSTVESAVDALLKYKAAHPGTEKLQLLPQDEYVYLNLTLKKIPPSPRTNPHKVPLTYPILDSSSELCLIIDDRPKTPTPPSDEIKKLIKSQSIPISKVLKLSKLKSNYKPFEAKRKLCDSYDMFLVDKRVVHLLPRLIGKEFFKKKRLPLGVDLSKKNLKSQVDRALGSALLYLRTGTCCMMKVGKVSMDRDEIVENVIDAFNGAVEKVPKKWDGVRSLHLKFCDSVALPIYQVLPDVKLKIEGLKEKVFEDEIEKISDTEVREIGGGDNGKSESKKRKKGRIHEVRYMDDGKDVEAAAAADGLDEIEKISDTEVREIGESKKRKKKKERIHKDRNMDDGKDAAAADGLDEIEHAKIVLSDGAKGKKKNKLKEKPNEGKDKAKDAKRKKRTAE